MPNDSNSNYPGALQVLAKQIAEMKLLPDANLPFLVELETQVIAEARSPELKMREAGLLPAEGANPMGAGQLGLPPGAGVGAGPGGMSAPPPSMMGAGNPGMPTAPAPANPDELQRILTA